MNSSKMNNSNPNLLTLDSSYDCKQLILGNCDLILHNFFDSFKPDYDKLFISKYSINESPLQNEKIFEIEFNYKEKAHETLLTFKL